MNLNLLIILPLLTCIAILFAASKNAVRMFALSGAIIQLVLCGFLLFQFNTFSDGVSNGQMIFESTSPWFSSLNINYHIGVDGISVSMILLTAFVVLAGILVSWKIEKMPKEFFFTSYAFECRSLWFLYFSRSVLYVLLS